MRNKLSSARQPAAYIRARRSRARRCDRLPGVLRRVFCPSDGELQHQPLHGHSHPGRLPWNCTTSSTKPRFPPFRRCSEPAWLPNANDPSVVSLSERAGRSVEDGVAPRTGRQPSRVGDRLDQRDFSRGCWRIAHDEVGLCLSRFTQRCCRFRAAISSIIATTTSAIARGGRKSSPPPRRMSPL